MFSMSLKVNIKKELECFRKNLEEIYVKYLKYEISYSKLNKNLSILAEKHKNILLRKDKFTNLSIILNLSKTRKIIKEYINLSVIEEIRQKNKLLFFGFLKK
ncbi:Telomere resolvase protein ResT (plasmid) [Borrelia nietonii YOR]|uniref:Telomere resolvase protein ResT n=1 Tax=Borrelia nietonii YOR TaxID=1293576 RepID=W5SBH6_9SPIR|nr:Telomere resolvase protein ResT [Borrelia nietonii YOR]